MLALNKYKESISISPLTRKEVTSKQFLHKGHPHIPMLSQFDAEGPYNGQKTVFSTISTLPRGDQEEMEGSREGCIYDLHRNTHQVCREQIPLSLLPNLS